MRLKEKCSDGWRCCKEQHVPLCGAADEQGAAEEEEEACHTSSRQLCGEKELEGPCTPTPALRHRGPVSH